MLKLSHRGLGLLNAQYRSVLKKCFLLNMVAASIMVAAPAMADDINWTANQTANTNGHNNNLDSKGEETIGELKDKMATVISQAEAGSSNAKPIGTLFVNSNFNEQLYSVDGTTTIGAWIYNYGDVYVGYTKDLPDGAISKTDGGVTISNKHNTDAINPTIGGGAFVNGKEAGGTYQPLLKVANTTFLNNSASPTDGDTTYIASGGAIANYSSNKEGIIENSKFTKNYVMGSGVIEGGAVANFAVIDQNNILDIGYMHSKNNEYTGNYAANETESTKDELTQFTNADAENARGGAVYNNGVFDSENDTFNSNYAKGTTAQGGAIYNEIYSDATASTTGLLTITNNGNTNFANNSVTGTLLAEGGAIYNSATVDSTGNIFVNNSASSDTEARGGAVYNNGTYNAESEQYSDNNVKAARALGGAVYNDKDGKFTITGNTEYTNNYASSTGEAGDSGAWGGAFYNDGTLTAVDGNLTFSGNYVSGIEHSRGGALANGSNGNATLEGTVFKNNYALNEKENKNSFGGAVYNEGEITITGATFDGNYSKSENGIAYGGAWANASSGENVMSPISKIIDSSFTNNQAISNSLMENNGNKIHGAQGGAIYNRATGYDDSPNLSRLQIIASNADVLFENNQAIAASGNGIGGAILNDNLGQLEINAENGHNIVFSNNSADIGGALADSASGNESKTSENAKLTVNATGGNIIFQNNKANSTGGVLYTYAAEGGEAFVVGNGYSLSFINNSAGSTGGAFAIAGNLFGAEYYSGNSELIIQKDGTINFIGNTAAEKGGAVYNLGKITLHNDGTDASGTFNFNGNTAALGAGIYNSANAVVQANLQNDTTILFNGNKATDGKGGAIYNEANGNVNIVLNNSSKLVFNTISDDVYNEGTVNIKGDSVNPTIISMAVVPQTVNNSQTQIVLNSTFAGSGWYNISNTQLNLGSTGYIDYDTNLNLSNNVINLTSGSYLNLNTGDVLTNNDFDIARNSVVNYKADVGVTDVDLANTVKNTGLLNIGDGVLTDVSINTLKSENGTIRIDVDNPNLKADRIIINNRIYGITDVAFDNSQNLKLEVGDKIYFAQTQSDQSLDDYKFVSNATDGIYEIGIDHDSLYDNDNTLHDWFFYRTKYLNPEVVGYIDLPRSAIEQTRSLMFNVGRLDKGSCNCYRDECNYKVCNFRDSGGVNRLWATPIYRSGTFDYPVETDVKVYGLDFGYDHQFSISSQFGIFGSYRDGNYDINGNGDGEYISHYGSELDITSILGGLYYRQYFGDLFMMGAVYGGQQSADIKADNGVSASTDGLNLGAQAEIGYDIKASERSVLTPSIKATYDYIKFDDVKDSAGKEVSFDTVHDLELEAGIKYEYRFNNENQLPTTGYIKPSIIQTIANGGDVKVKDTTFDKTIENETLGRIEVGADAEIIENFSLGAFGNYTFGSKYKAWGVGGNIRYKW